MQIGIDKDGTKIFCALFLERRTSDGYDEWHGTSVKPGEDCNNVEFPYHLAQEYPLTYTLKEYWPDGTTTHKSPYHYRLYHVELPDEFKSLTWEDEAVDVEIVRDDENGNMWVCREGDGNLVLFFTEPHRNGLESWNSKSTKISLVGNESFKELTSDCDPVKVRFRRK